MGWKSKKGATRRAYLKTYSNGYINGGMLIDNGRARILAETKFGGTGNTVLYRDHVKSMGHVRGSDLKIGAYHDLPPTLAKTVQEYEGIPDDKVPPIIAVLRKRKVFRQGEVRGQGFDEWMHWCVIPGQRYQLYCFFKGTEAYFVEFDFSMNRVRKSCLYTTDRARVLCSTESKLDRIRWTDQVRLGQTDTPDTA